MKTRILITLVLVGALTSAGWNLPSRQPASAAGGGSFPLLGGQEQQTAMERVKELSAKSLALADKCMALQKENEALRSANRELTASSAKAGLELAQAKKELKDANTMLDELTADLQRWKADVLGWRGKIAEAQAEQIKKLVQIINFLNGEFPEGDGKTVVKTGGEAKPPSGSKDRSDG